MHRCVLFLWFRRPRCRKPSDEAAEKSPSAVHPNYAWRSSAVIATSLPPYDQLVRRINASCGIRLLTRCVLRTAWAGGVTSAPRGSQDAPKTRPRRSRRQPRRAKRRSRRSKMPPRRAKTPQEAAKKSARSTKQPARSARVTAKNAR